MHWDSIEIMEPVLFLNIIQQCYVVVESGLWETLNLTFVLMVTFYQGVFVILTELCLTGGLEARCLDSQFEMSLMKYSYHE